MSEPRTNTQKLLTLHVDDTLFQATEKARGRKNRSQWIREAIAEKCAREKVEVPEDAVYAPDRGRKTATKWAAETHRKTAASPEVTLQHLYLNDETGGTLPPNDPAKKTIYPKKAPPKKRAKE